MSRKLRGLKRKIIKNITKKPSAKNIIKGTLRGTYNAAVSAKNAAVSAKNAAVSAKDSTVSSVKKKYFGNYEDEYLNENNRNTKTDDINGSAWIKVYDVAESDKDNLDEIEKMKDSVGTDKDKINPIIHINESEIDIEKEIEKIKEEFDEEEFSSSNFNIFDASDEDLEKKGEDFNKKKAEILEQKKAEILEQLITHIKEKKYTEKAGIRNVKRALSTKKIVIPYSNIDENDFSVKNLKDELLKKFKILDKVYIEIEENGILNYYISTPIKKYLRYAIVKERIIKDDKKKEKELAKKEKQKKLDAKKSEANKLFDDIGVDILSDNIIFAIPPCSKLAKAYCNIHPFNVILYEKITKYGLILEKVNYNPGTSNSYENIKDFFEQNDGVSSFNVIDEKIKEVYISLSSQASAPKESQKAALAAKGKVGGKQIGGGTEVIDLTGVKEVIDIVYDAKYLESFESKKFYYKYEDNGIEIYYLCKSSILDYRYNHKSWESRDKEKYYNDNSIDKAGLQSNLNSIKKLNNNLTITLKKIREKAIENGNINKNKEVERQDRSDERFNDNAGKVGFYTTQLFVYTAKYIQDTFLAGIKVLFSSSWNNVITGFLIFLFIILVIIMGVVLGKGENDSGNYGPNKKPKEENKDFISLLKSMPANINSAYADFNNFATNLGNMITNGRRAVNDFTEAITGDNIPEDLVRLTTYDKDEDEDKGRGGDNIIHFYNENNEISGVIRSGVISAYKPIAKIIPKQNGINSTGQKINETNFKLKSVPNGPNGDGQLYKLDCDNSNTSNYFTKSCKLRKDYSLDTRFIKEPESDYEQIKIND
uniref:Uncharacterized protein n=1 Tax=Virus NIOZ-UU159 TaxID=2763270 RepID=A0A7S9STA8_9VIRU|nr:MAG: hypothetical protein NIOZUU159_00287 [Virus NIOZ-UU159]